MSDRTRAFPIGATTTIDQLDRDPHPVLARLREHEPVSWLPALGGWLVTSYALAVEAMRAAELFTVDDERFSTAQVIGPSMLSLDGEAHAAHRAPFVAPFRPRAVRERFENAVRHQVDRQLAALAPRGKAELRRGFAGPLAASIVASALGLDPGEAGTVLGWYDAIVAGVTEITATGRVPDSARAAYAALDAHLRRVIDGGDRRSLLAVAAGGGTLTHEQLASNAGVLLFGGIETTEGMIANAMLALLERPDDLERVRAEPGLVDRAIEESLRLEPAAAVIDRYATAATMLGGATIEAGELVRVSLAGANRDPAVFDDPDRFELDRAATRGPAHLAFAQGPHVCVGVHLARLEARIAVAALLARLPGLRLDPDHVPKVGGLVFRKPASLHVRWDGP
jgi:cytochrome P450